IRPSLLGATSSLRLLFGCFTARQTRFHPSSKQRTCFRPSRRQADTLVLTVCQRVIILFWISMTDAIFTSGCCSRSETPCLPSRHQRPNQSLEPTPGRPVERLKDEL